jgi:hypothetical protein
MRDLASLRGAAQAMTRTLQRSLGRVVPVWLIPGPQHKAGAGADERSNACSRPPATGFEPHGIRHRLCTHSYLYQLKSAYTELKITVDRLFLSM